MCCLASSWASGGIAQGTQISGDPSLLSVLEIEQFLVELAQEGMPY